MNQYPIEPQTYAAYIPTCKECGSTVVTVYCDFTKGEKPHLGCGHPPHFVLIPNPKLAA